MTFHDRNEAATLLAKKLEMYKNTDTVVIAIPRGGVPVGSIVARELNLPFDIFLSKKIGHPHNPELAIGSVTLQGAIVDGSVLDVSTDYIQNEANRILQSLKEKYRLYTGAKKRVSVKGKNVIIVDDGIATGSTILGTIEVLKKELPSGIIVATPVAAPAAAAKIINTGTRFICLETPEDLVAIGQFYADFSPVSDREVIDLLKNSRQKKIQS